MPDAQDTQDPQYAQTLQWARDQLASLQAQPKIDPTGSPADGTRQSWTSLFGDVLGGGQGPGYQLRGQEADTAGNRALLNFGINMLLASGPQRVKPDLLSAAATGLQGAQQSLDVDQRRGALAAGAQQEYAQKQQEMQIARIKEAVPLLTLLQQSQSADAARRLAGSGATPPAAGGGNIAAPLSDDKATALKQIAARESGGNPTALNYVANEDPTAYARGATASGKYQIVNSTWAEGAKLAGVDVAKYPTARDAPEAVQDQVASALWDKYGNKPWQKGAQDWVKGADGRYSLQPVAAPPGGAKLPAPYQVATAGSAVPPPPGGAPAAPPTVADLVGPRPLPPTGPGAGVATPASIANTPVQTAQAQPPPVAPAAAPVAQQPTTPPPSPYPDIKAGEGLIRHPGSFAEFSARESVPVPQTELYNPNMTPQQQAAFAIKQQALALKQQQVSSTLNPADVGKGLIEVKAEQAALQAEMQTAAQAKAQAASAAIEKYNENQQKQLQARYDAATNAYTTAAQSQLASAQKASESDLTSRLASRTKVLEGLDTEATASHENLTQLGIVKQLSDAAGQPGVLASYPEVRSWMTKLGIATPEQSSQWSAQQALDASTQKLTLAAAAGAGLGRITDKDLEFLRRGNPQSVSPQDWRNAQIGYLMTIYDRKQKFAGLVHQFVADGKSLTDAQDAADERLGPLIKQMPKTNKDGAPMTDTDRGKWNFDNLQPGQFYKNAGGDIQIFNPGKRRRPE